MRCASGVIIFQLVTVVLNFATASQPLPKAKTPGKPRTTQPGSYTRPNRQTHAGKHIARSKAHGLPGENINQCTALTIPVCQHLNLYHKTRLPNVFGHNSQHEVERALRKYAPLMKKPRCGESLSLLLCLSYVPPCDITPRNGSGSSRATLPCRQLCSSVWSGCGHLLENSGILWPLGIDCERLPAPDLGGEGCISTRGPPLQGAPQTGFTKRHKEPAPPAPPRPAGHTPKTVVKKKTTPPSPISTIHVGSHGNATKTLAKKTHQNWRREKPQKQSSKAKQVLKSKQTKMAKGSVNSALKRRRYDITEVGDPRLFHGWVDVQGQGAANDYCRVVGEGSKQRFMSCALAGSTGDSHVYVSKRGFDVGHRGSWFMRDMDGDGRDDYCRCVGRGLASKMACMKAKDHGFVGSLLEPGNQYTFYIKGPPCLGRTVNPVLGVGTSR